MFLGILLFVFYFLLFSFLLKYLVRRFALLVSYRQFLVLFALKVTLGCFYGYLFLTLYQGDDTWLYHRQALDEYQYLLKHPIAFFTDVFHNGYPGGLMDRLFEANNSYWKSLEYTFLLKLLALFDIFSRGYYYVNVLFFSFLTLWGNYFFYALFSKYFPAKKSWFLGLFFLFLPFIFWTSGIRKDGLILLFSGFVFFLFDRLLSRQAGWKSILFGGVSFFFIFIVRNYVAIALAPALLGWYLSNRREWNAWKIFLTIGLSGFILFLISSFFPNSIDLPSRVAQRQQEFMELEGGSRVGKVLLDSSATSYFVYFPKAVNHVFFRPYPFERNSMLYQGSAIETYFSLFIFLVAVYFLLKEERLRDLLINHPFLLTCLFFSMVNLLLIGYTVPFIGAIVRYKSLYEVLLLGVCLCLIPFPGRKQHISF